MALVLNGGVDGTGSTQYAHHDALIVSALPVTVSVWFKAGTNASAAGQIVNWVDADATLGNYRMGGGLGRSLGPVLSRNIISRVATSSGSPVTTLDTLGQSVTEIVTGATTLVSVTDASAFSAGEWVKLSGTFSGITGITSGREHRISSVASNTLALELATSGVWGDGQSATVKWSAWQPEKWNLMVLALTTASGARLRSLGGFVGNSGVSIFSEFAGTLGNYPADIFDVIDRLCLGATFQSGSATNYFRGEAAHLAVWNGASPTESQAAELLALAPNLVSWGAPTAYWPLLSDETDSIGSADLTLVGTPDITSDGPSITLTGGGGGSGTFIPSIMRAQPTNLFGF
jgi:hypothetical protein